MNLKILRHLFFFITLLILFSSNAFSQCFETQSILVDACDGTAEGLNEMVRFKIGTAPLNTATLTAAWPNTTISWKGLIQNTATAAIVTQLNTDIALAGGCGQIVEPTGGILPANATVILVTSYLMSPAANPFGPISDTIYMIFQNSTLPTGHFANFGPAPGARTLTMNFIGSCSDAVIYDRTLLTNTSGANVAADGATVNFTAAGVASYVNNGCKAPVPPFNVDAGPQNLNVCAGTTIALNGIAEGQQSVVWSSTSGGFSSPTTTATNYTIAPADGGTTVVLKLEATNSCGLKISDEINLFVASNSIPDFATTQTLCSSDIAPVLATTSSNGITGTWSPTTINTTTSGTYIFTPTAGLCASNITLAVTIIPETIPDFATTQTLCSRDVATILSTTSPNGITGTWNPTTINTTTSGTYTFTPTAGQCASSVTLAVAITPETIPDFATTQTLCSSDVAPVLATTSPNGITGTWNPATINTTTSGTYTFTPTVGQCASNVTLTVTITPQTIPDFVTTQTLCSSDVAPVLATTSPNGITGTWNPTTINTVTNGNYVFTPTSGQCALSVTLQVLITSLSFTITQQCVNNIFLVKAETNSSSTYNFTWFNDKGDQIKTNSETFDFTEYSANYKSELVYPLQFKVLASNGSCEIEQSFEVSNNLCGIPNVISPNGDGINDTLDLTNFNVNNISIFNRYGRKVYSFEGKYVNQWDGQWKDGKLPTGTYYYIISSENGDQKAGWIFLSY